MARSIWLPTLLGIVLGCNLDPSDQEFDTASPANADAHGGDLEARRAILEDSLQSVGIHLRFWLEDSVPVKLAAHFALWDGACGLTAGAVLTRMPSLKHPILGGEEALETDESGEIIRRWYIPINTLLAGVDGDDLLLDWRYSDFPYVLAVGSDGELGIRTRPSEWPENVQCQSDMGYEDSAYFRCFKVADETSGEKRLIGHQGPCT